MPDAEPDRVGLAAAAGCCGGCLVALAVVVVLVIVAICADGPRPVQDDVEAVDLETLRGGLDFLNLVAAVLRRLLGLPDDPG